MLTIFSEEGYQIRTVTVRDEVHFVARDLAKPLGIKNIRNKIALLDDDETCVHFLDTGGGIRKMTVLTEPGLYSLILSCPKSRKKGTAAWRYRRWVTHEVLPELHRTGRVEINQLTLELEFVNTHRLYHVAWDILKNTVSNYYKVKKLVDVHSDMITWKNNTPYIREKYYNEFRGLLETLKKQSRYSFLKNSDSEGQ
jgi:prophage antirepressor-like protein